MKRRGWLVAIASVALVASFASIDASSADAGTASRTLTIEGNVARPVVWGPAALQALPQSEVVSRAPDGRPRVYRGVLLRDLLAAAKPIETGRFDLRRTLVVASATDGYLALFTWQELADTVVGDGALVATSLDGAPLGDDEGAFAIVSGNDRRSGPRHVRWLESIEIRRVDR